MIGKSSEEHNDEESGEFIGDRTITQSYQLGVKHIVYLP